VYSKEGELIYDEVTISPIFDKQRKKLINFLTIHKDIATPQKLLQKIKKDLC